MPKPIRWLIYCIGLCSMLASAWILYYAFRYRHDGALDQATFLLMRDFAFTGVVAGIMIFVLLPTVEAQIRRAQLKRKVLSHPDD
jgi:hypothetical protein